MAASAVLALLLLAQVVPPGDAAVSTAPRMPTTRSTAAAAAATPSIANHSPPPTDDYGYVAWCYGALDSYLSLYDRVMPEVTRIERAFPSPRGADDDLKVYPEMRAQARKDLAGYRTAILAAEKTSPRPIADYGAASVRQGQSVWDATNQMSTVQIAREWMGWSPPAKCDDNTKTLLARSAGPAQSANKGSALDAIKAIPSATPAPEPTPVAAPPAPAEPPPATIAAAAPPEPSAPAAPEPAAQPAAAPKVATAAPKPAPKPAPAKGPAAPALPIGAYVMDPNSDKGCPGRIDASVRAGRVVMVCLPIG